MRTKILICVTARLWYAHTACDTVAYYYCWHTALSDLTFFASRQMTCLPFRKEIKIICHIYHRHRSTWKPSYTMIDGQICTYY